MFKEEKKREKEKEKYVRCSFEEKHAIFGRNSFGGRNGIFANQHSSRHCLLVSRDEAS